MARTYAMELKAGEKTTLKIDWQDNAGNRYDLSSGYTARLQFRETVGQAAFSDELTTANSRIVLLDDLGDHNVQLLWSTEQSEAMTSTTRTQYTLEGDLELLNGGEVVKSIRIILVVVSEFTR